MFYSLCYSIASLASPQTSFGVRLSRIHFSPHGRLLNKADFYVHQTQAVYGFL